MATEKSATFREALARFRTLSIPEQREVLLAFQSLHEDALNKRKTELLEELNTLGMPARREPGGRHASHYVARYRSKKDPLLVWSGRGRMARWLVEEIEQSGLPKEAFRVR